MCMRLIDTRAYSLERALNKQHKKAILKARDQAEKFNEFVTVYLEQKYDVYRLFKIREYQNL